MRKQMKYSIRVSTKHHSNCDGNIIQTKVHPSKNIGFKNFNILSKSSTMILERSLRTDNNTFNQAPAKKN